MTHLTGNWYVMYTRPNHEKKVVHHLAENNIECYLPLTRTLRQWHDRRKFIVTPVFPSYVFVYLDSWKHYHNALDHTGALYFVKTGSIMASVEKSVIESIRLAVGDGTGVEVTPQFMPGQPVVIQEGPFTGLEGELVQHQGKDKIQVRVNLLQRSLLVTVAPEYLMVM